MRVMEDLSEEYFNETEQIVIKSEPIYDDDNEDRESDFQEEPAASWKPIKIESILNDRKETSPSPEIQTKKPKKSRTKKKTKIKIKGEIQDEDEESEQLVRRPIKIVKLSKEDLVYEDDNKLKKNKKKKTKIDKKAKPKQEELSDEFMCSKCSKRCANLAGLSSHYSRCGIKLENASNIIQTPEGTYCTDCGREFKDLRGAKMHAFRCSTQSGPNLVEDETYIDENPFICDICGATFRIKSKIKHHMLLEHTADSRFECDVCGKRSAAKSIHEIHIRSHLPVSNRPFPCIQCTKYFKTKFELQKHLYAVHVSKEDKPAFPCDECDFQTHTQEFLIKYKINKHVPNDEKPFQCTFCARGFFSDKELNNHVKSHSTERNHKCPQCDRRCKTNAEMKEHFVKAHTNAMPFICEICQKGCNCRHAYRRHVTKHEKELGTKLDKSVRKFNLRLEDYIVVEK